MNFSLIEATFRYFTVNRKKKQYGELWLILIYSPNFGGF